MRTFVAVLLAVAWTGAARGARAQSCTPNANGALYPALGPLALRLPTSTRALAMGDVNVGGRDDDVVFYDPAQLSVARGTSMSVERFAAGTVGGAGSTVVRAGSAGIGIGVSAVQYEAPACVNAPDLRNFAAGGQLLGSSAQVVIGAARGVGAFRVGAAAKFAEDIVPASVAGSVVADVGVARDLTTDAANMTVALVVQNIGRDVHPAGAHQALPLRTTLGLAGGAPIGAFDVGGTAAVSVRRDGFVAPAGGAEISWVWIEGYALTARVGARRPEDGLGSVTAGAGFAADRFSFDYALETLSGQRVAHRVGIRIR